MLDLSSGNSILLIIYGIVVSSISFFIILYATPKIIKFQTLKGSVVQDYHKPGRYNIPRPAGPVLLLGIAAAEILLYSLTLNMKVIAILLTTVFAFIIGFIDDRNVMPGWFKPIALIGAALPLIALGAHGTHLNLIFGDAYIPLLLTSIAIFSSNEVFLAALPLLFSMVAFYKYHKFPSKIFPGDSGTLLMGGMYGAIAIAGSSEIIGVIALLPAVMNSFLFLASVKKIIEHRQVKARPTILMNDFRLMASKEKHAPTTLLRLILAKGPLSEKEIGYQIFKLAIFSSFLAFISIIIQYYFLTGAGIAK